MEPKILRIVYVFLFLVALMAVFTAWGQIGGQYHLDIMAWYWKLGLGVGMSWVIVKAAAASVSSERAWNRRVLQWLAVLVVLGVVAGVVTYYYHVYEPQDEEEQQDEVTPAAAVYNWNRMSRTSHSHIQQQLP